MENLNGTIVNINKTKIQGVSHAGRYIGSVAGGAMLGAAIAGVWDNGTYLSFFCLNQN